MDTKEVFTTTLAEQRIGLLTAKVGKKPYRLQMGGDEVHFLDWGGLRELRVTDVLIYEGVGGEEDFQLAIKEAQQKHKPVETVLEEFGLLEEDLLPVIEERMIVEAIHGLLEVGKDPQFEDNDGTPPVDPEVSIGVETVLEFMTKVEEDLEQLKRWCVDGAEAVRAIDSLRRVDDPLARNHRRRRKIAKTFQSARLDAGHRE